jgi:hypothetical protein
MTGEDGKKKAPSHLLTLDEDSDLQYGTNRCSHESTVDRNREKTSLTVYTMMHPKHLISQHSCAL